MDKTDWHANEHSEPVAVLRRSSFKVNLIKNQAQGCTTAACLLLLHISDLSGFPLSLGLGLHSTGVQREQNGRVRDKDMDMGHEGKGKVSIQATPSLLQVSQGISGKKSPRRAPRRCGEGRRRMQQEREITW